MRFIILFVLHFTFISCGSSSSSSSDNNSSSNDNSNNSPLIGKWVTSCQNDNSASNSYQLTFNFDENGSAYFDEVFYYNLNCANGEEEERWKSFYTFTDENNNLNFTRTKVEMSVHNTTLRNVRNTDSWCGFTNWTIDVVRDVTNVSCDGFDTSTTESPINPNYSINSNELEFSGYEHFNNEIFIKN